VVSTPLKNMKVSWEGLSNILWNNEIHVPNHQPVYQWAIFNSYQPPATDPPTVIQGTNGGPGSTQAFNEPQEEEIEEDIEEEIPTVGIAMNSSYFDG